MITALHTFATILGIMVISFISFLVIMLVIGSLLQAISLTAVQVIAVIRHGRTRSDQIKWHKLPYSFLQNWWMLFSDFSIGSDRKIYNQYYNWSGIFKFKIYPRENRDYYE